MNAARLLLSLFTLALLASCGQTKMVVATGQIRSYMLEHNYNAALATLRQSKVDKSFKEQDRVVFWMNEGMLLHLTGQYADSNNALESAERRSEELYTKKISKEVKAAFTSDAAKDYAGEDYENVLVNVMKTLNYLGLGKQESALVEARKINEKLQLYDTRYEQKNVYSQDAFAHWLMGILFEMEKSYDDARIAYSHALTVYKNEFAGNYGSRVPSYLGEDLVRAALLSGDTETADKIKGELGGELGGSAEEMKTKGEIVLVHFNGEGPSKSDYFITCFFRDITYWRCDGEPGGEFMKKTTITIPKNGTVIKVAFPELHIREPANTHLTMSVAGASAQSEIALPISRIAIKTLADKMHRIFKDAIIRVITKTLAAKAAGGAGNAAGGKNKKAGAALGWLAETATSATMQANEEADKRAWITLPSRIEVARARVAPGTYTVNLKLPRGHAAPIKNVKVEAGKRVFITHYSMP